MTKTKVRVPEINWFADVASGIGAPTQQDITNEILCDIKGAIEKHLFIKTKKGELIPFKLNRAQNHFIAYVQKCLDHKEPIRAIILKARQLGFSTLIEAIIFMCTVSKENTHSRIIAHDTKSSGNLFSMTEIYYDHLAPEFRPMKRFRNRNELTFENPREEERAVNPGLLSKIEVDTASNLKAGRSAMAHFIHASELAFWDRPGEVLTGMIQSVPDNVPFTGIFLESTANGVGDYFHMEWEAAERGESVYTPFFYPWFDEDEYKTPLTPEEKKAFTLDAEEIRLQNKFNLSIEQLNWRRHKIRSLDSMARSNADPTKIGLSGTQLFQQEFPSEAREAFLSTGRPVFNIDALQWYEHRIDEPAFIGNLIEDKSGKLMLDATPDGYLAVWERPVPTEGYIIGMDIAEGMGAGDYTYMAVLGQKSYNLVAEWWGHIDPDLALDEVEKLGIFYNKAFIVPEANNHGLVVCIGLRERRYPRLYIRKSQGLRHEKVREEIGWRTDVKTKPLMIHELAGDIRDHIIGIPSAKTLDELFKYVRDEKGRFAAQPGSHDDRVMGLALAVQGHRVAPRMYRLDRSSETRVKHTRKVITKSGGYTGYR